MLDFAVMDDDIFDARAFNLIAAWCLGNEGIVKLNNPGLYFRDLS